MNGDMDNVKSIILARLLTQPKKGFTKSALKKDLSSIVEHRWMGETWTQQFNSIWNRLLADGLAVDEKKVNLTESGTQHILQYFGWSKKPPRLQWRTVKEKYLPARFLGLNPGSDGFKKRFKGTGTLRAECIRQRYDLKIESMPTEVQAMNALLSVSGMGMRNSNLGEMEKALLRRMIDGSTFQIKKPVPHTISPAKRHSTKPFDLDTFARETVECARSSPTGWRGDNKVFISHVWRLYQQKHPGQICSLEDFKKKLIEANHELKLTLASADMVGVMNPTDVHESETPYLNECFHFIRTRR